MRICHACQKPIRDTDPICPYCGAAQKTEYLFALPVGSHIHGRYRIDRMIGRGGTAITYQVYDKNFDRTAALKEYFPAEIANRMPGSKDVILYASKRMAEYSHGFHRFLHEARMTIKFQSQPHIVQVQEYFEENNTAYIVMEYLDGETLKEKLKKGVLPYDEAVKIGVQVCSALSEMHKQKVIHRDISPDNIFICNDGNVKVIDFGAACSLIEEKQNLIIDYKIGFTPLEQYAKGEMLDTRSDIYTLGATLYMAMSGIHPTDAKERDTRDDLKPLHILFPEIPTDIGNAIITAMELEKEFRYSTAEAFAEALEQHSKNMIKEWIQRHRKKMVVISLSVTFSILFIALSVFLGLWIHRIQTTTLPEAELTLWYTADQLSEIGQQKITGVTTAVQNFETLYPHVNIHMLAIPETEYTKKLKDMIGKETGPDVFMYDITIEESMVHTKALDKVRKITENGGYFGYDKAEDSPYVFCGYNVPLVYSTKKNTDVSFYTNMDRNLFSTIRNNHLLVGLYSKAEIMYNQILQMEIPKLETLTVQEDTASLFVDGAFPIYYSDTSEYTFIQNHLAGKYTVYKLNRSPVYCSPANAWSISAEVSGKKEKVAVRLLQFLLSAEGQECLYIQGGYPAVPVQKDVLDTYQSLRPELWDALSATGNTLQ